MSTASDERGDLSVQLDWPVDPLAPSNDEEHARSVAAGTPVAPRLEALEQYGARTVDPRDDLAGAVDELAERVEHVVAEFADALRAIDDTMRRAIDENAGVIDDRITSLRTAIMSMLASRQTDDQRTQRRERETLMASVAEEMATISRSVTEALAAGRSQTDVFADRVAAEIQGLRRRIPVKGGKAGTGGLDDATMDELVSRVSDEVEIRIAAALKPKPKPVRRKTGSPPR